MGRQAAVVLYVLALVAVVVGVDVLFFRNRFWERLTVNVVPGGHLRRNIDPRASRWGSVLSS